MAEVPGLQKQRSRTVRKRSAAAEVDGAADTSASETAQDEAAVSTSATAAPTVSSASSADAAAVDGVERRVVSSDDPLSWAHPLVREWFTQKFGTPTEPQQLGWPHIVNERSVLISAPTGSGKTLSAFLACIDALVRKALNGSLKEETEVIYISPLKALSNDVNKNLETPLAEIMELARSKGLPITDIRTAVRTGDTLAPERRSMLSHPPHILVTTPESFYILLTAEKSRAVLQTVTSVIVDEIHAMADDKRGSHLTLSLERLEELCPKSPVRIGLSATQKPIETIARFLVGNNRDLPQIIQVSSKRKLDIAVNVPEIPLGAVASNELWDDMYDRIAKYSEEHRSVLVFVNTRRLAERVAHNLAERIGEELVGTHHGSLSRKLRLTAEQKLKSGEYKVLVATASLELGIDIGDIDLVCQIGSPRSIAVALQRIGRAGHWRGAVPKGRLFATTRDELIECAAVVKAIKQGELDRILIPEQPRDVLAQQIVATCATGDWNEDDLFALIKRAYPYRNLSRETYEQIIEMLSEGLAGQRAHYSRYLHRDKINNLVKGRRGARLHAITNGGAIPDSSVFAVVAEPEQIKVGTVDEEFAVESNRGDIFLLGNTSWRVRRVEATAGRILVDDAHGAPPTVPFWRGEAPSRTSELSVFVSQIRKDLERFISDSELPTAVQMLKDDCGLDDDGAQQVIDYITAGLSLLGVVPTQETVVAERFFDESGGMQLIIHAPFGGRINKAWGLALRKKLGKMFNTELQAAATDDGIIISLADQQSFPLADVFHYLKPESLRQTLEQTALQSPLFPTRWRWDANRALALLRFIGGRKVPPYIQRIRAEDLLAAVFPDAIACQDNADGDVALPKHPLVDEVMNDILNDAIDLGGLQRVIADITGGAIRCVAIDTPKPSEFCHEILNANPYAYLDDAPLEERRARAVGMRRFLPGNIVAEHGKLDPAAIETVCRDAMPDIRDADELHDLLKTVIALPEDFKWSGEQSSKQLWSQYFDVLKAAGRAIERTVGARIYWVSQELIDQFNLVYCTDELVEEPTEEPIGERAEEPTEELGEERAEERAEEPTKELAVGSASVQEKLIEQIVSGWLMHLGPVTANALAAGSSLTVSEVERALLKIESAGAVLRGAFSSDGVAEWCDRNLLARIHRLTIGIIRKQIEPVSAAQFMSWLFSWQHVAPSTQLVLQHGTLEVLRQLQGFEVGASSWEPQILSRRVRNYRDSYLDNLCLTGQIGWARLSPHPALMPGRNPDDPGSRRIIPTSASPIAFYSREDCNWMTPHGEFDYSVLGSQAKKVLEFLTARGASFFFDIVRATRLLKTEVETALWELVTAGLVTSDGFDNLRALTNPKRRAGAGLTRGASRTRHGQGRWTVVNTDPFCDADTHVEAVCWMLLKRYGVIFRELLTRETNLPKWRDMLLMLRRLEARGEIRGGRFIDGFLGEQFALPMAVESLRATKNVKREEPEVVRVSAADPLNLVGKIVPGSKVPANSSAVIVFENGVFKAVE